MGKILVIAGTDTNVGKTLIAAALGAHLVEAGHKISVCKPFESGEPLRADSRFLKEMIPVSQSLDAINLYAFHEALAPGVATEREGRSIDLNHIKRHIDGLAATSDWLLIEGAGGLFVPIAPATSGTGHLMLIDWLETLDYPVLLVGRLGLGTINHSLLSIAELKRRHIPITGLVLNQTTPTISLAEETNPEILARNTDVPIVGPFGYLPKIDRSTLLAEANRVWGRLGIG